MATADLTKTRLLEAAGEEFAAKGFEGATIRAICQRAGANIAAVNYHFGDKEKLYAATVRYAHVCATRHTTAAEASKLSPRERLRLFVHGFFMGILEEGRPAWHAKLMAREMAEPTAVLNEIAKHGVKPRVEALSAIVREILGPRASQKEIYRCARSIVGQCLHYRMARPITERLVGREAFTRLDLDYLTDHITAFSGAALGIGPPLDFGGEPVASTAGEERG